MLVGGPAVADRHAGQRHASRHDEHEPPGEAGAGLLGRGVLAALRSWTRSSARAVEAPVEVAAAELVGDEQRLADGVGGGVGEPVLQHAERAVEVGRQQPLPLRGGEGGPQLAGPRRPTSNRACGIDRPSEPVRMRISSIMRGQRLLRGGPPMRAAGARYDGDGNVAANAAVARAGSTPPKSAYAPRPAGHDEQHGDDAPANSPTATSSRPACASQSRAPRRGAAAPAPRPRATPGRASRSATRV